MRYDETRLARLLASVCAATVAAGLAVVVRGAPAATVAAPRVSPAPSASPSPSPGRAPAAKPSPRPSPTAPALPPPPPPPPGPTLSGAVVGPDGRAVQGAHVAIYRNQGFFEAFAVFATLGFACIDGSICSADERKTVTDSRGRFTVGVPSYANQRYLLAVVGADGTRTELSFTYSGKSTRLPTVPLLRSRVGLRDSGGTTRLSWTAPPRLFGIDDVDVVALDSQGREVIRAGDVREGAFPTVLVEDLNVRFGLVADGRLGGHKVRYFGPRTSYAGHRRPMSRGALCVTYTRTSTHAHRPCRLTDGDLATAFDPPYRTYCSLSSKCSEARESTLYLDLGRRKAMSLVVLRECTFGCEVELSDDARTWRQVATPEARPAGTSTLVALPRGSAARYVRVRFSFSIDVSSITEISVF